MFLSVACKSGNNFSLWLGLVGPCLHYGIQFGHQTLGMLLSIGKNPKVYITSIIVE